jgi:hypothetical protein
MKPLITRASATRAPKWTMGVKSDARSDRKPSEKTRTLNTIERPECRTARSSAVSDPRQTEPGAEEPQTRLFLKGALELAVDTEGPDARLIDHERLTPGPVGIRAFERAGEGGTRQHGPPKSFRAGAGEAVQAGRVQIDAAEHNH